MIKYDCVIFKNDNLLCPIKDKIRVEYGLKLDFISKFPQSPISVFVNHY